MTLKALRPESWVDQYADYLFSYAITRVNDEEIAKDLIQETFFAALNAAKNFKGTASERTWLIAILKRKIIDHYRKKNSIKGKATVRMQYASQSNAEGDWLEEQIADPDSTTENDALENEELRLAIQRCLGQLPENQRRVFTMKTEKGLSTEDICNELHINPSNLWVMIHRARRTLMECLNQNWFKL